MEAVEELALQRFVGFLVQLAPLERGLGLRELGADPGRVVELRLGLLDDLLEHPDEPASRRERKGEDAADQSHQATAGMASRTKLYGGSGPTSLKWSGGGGGGGGAPPPPPPRPPPPPPPPQTATETPRPPPPPPHTQPQGGRAP